MKAEPLFLTATTLPDDFTEEMLEELRGAPPPAGPNAARLRVITSLPWFVNCILLCIGVNCVLLALDDPTRTGPPPAWASACDAVLAVIFALELALKLVAWRLHYWRGGVLNWLDALVAAEGVLGVVLHYSGASAGGGGGADISMIRMLRLMRPLRTLNRFPSVKVVVDALARSMSGVTSVLLILCACVGGRSARAGRVVVFRFVAGVGDDDANQRRSPL